MMAEKVRKLLEQSGWSVVDLAKAQGTSPQNFYNKLKRDNFSERELQGIADMLGAKLQIEFVTEYRQKI